jgi:hypothetical protein
MMRPDYLTVAPPGEGINATGAQVFTGICGTLGLIAYDGPHKVYVT